MGCNTKVNIVLLVCNLVLALVVMTMLPILISTGVSAPC